MYCHIHHCHYHHCKCVPTDSKEKGGALTQEELLAYTQEMKEELKDYTVDLKDQIFSYIDIGVNPVEIANTFASLKGQDTYILNTLTNKIDELNNSSNLSIYNLRTKVTDLEGQSASTIVELNKVKLDTGITATAKFGGDERTQASKNAETVSVEDFGASTSNADNTSAINAANTYALSVGATVKYPNGEYTVLGDIPDLHKVRAYGTGVIVRDGNKFYIEPTNTQTNIIYVGNSGTGDGLTRNSTIRISAMLPALKNLSNRTGAGYYRIHLTAGTYTDKGVRFTDVPPFANELEFLGDLDTEGEHATIWDGTASNAAYAMRCDLVCSPLRVKVTDIMFQNWSKSTNSGALVFWGGHQLTTENVKVDSCGIGIWTARNAVHRSWGDTLSNCTTFGIATQYSSSAIIGISTKRTKFSNCNHGFHVGRASIGHNDYADYDGNRMDLYVTQNSRIAHINPTFKNWTQVSLFIQNGAILEGLDVCTFDPDSISELTPILLTSGGAIIDSIAGKGIEILHQSFVPISGFTVTGTVDKTHVSAVDSDGSSKFGAWLRIPQFLLYQGESISVRYRTKINGSNATGDSRFILSGSGSSAAYELWDIALPASGYIGIIDVTLTFNKEGKVYADGTLTTPSGTAYSSKVTTKTSMDANFRSKTSDLTYWRTYVQPANTSDTCTVYSIQSWVTL